jgi:hypothetical protein
MPLPVKAGDIFDKARFFLNDTEGAVFTDTVLLPALQIAAEDLRLECEDNNIPYTNVTSEIISVPAGTVNIGGTDGPALPTDLVEIIEMYERIAGTNNDFVMMKRRNFLPKTEFQTTYLEVYTWQKQQVHFIGATGDIEVKIDYVGNTINAINNANSEVLLFNSISFLWFRTAALAANYIGENETRSTQLNSEAARCIETMENIGIKNQQSMPVRRRPFMASYRQRGWASGYAR